MRTSPSATRSYNESVTMPSRRDRMEDSVIEPITATTSVQPVYSIGRGKAGRPRTRHAGEHRAAKNTVHRGIDLDVSGRFQPSPSRRALFRGKNPRNRLAYRDLAHLQVELANVTHEGKWHAQRQS